MKGLADSEWKNFPAKVNESVDLYNKVLAELLNKHAPMKNLSVIQRKPSPWIDDSILEMKRKRRQAERTWRKSRLCIHFDI